MSPTPAVGSFLAWREERVAAAGFRCEPIDLADSKEWSLVDGLVRHRTGGFFSLAGFRVTTRTGDLDERPRLIILQPETAINGFLIRRGPAGAEVLFQGRVEPGNVGVMQLAPTVQSTEANYQRKHGGGATAYIEWFLEPGRAPVLHDSLQSEEATRYHGKYNRNVVMDVTGLEVAPPPPGYRWFPLADLREFAVTSNVLNTDARSVLSCLGWEHLAGEGGPFAGHSSGDFGAALRDSLAAPPEVDDAPDREVLAWLVSERVRLSPRPRVLRLDELPGWEVVGGEIREREPRLGYRAQQYAVLAAGREVASWDQPLIDSAGVGRLTLVAQVRGGVLRFLVRPSYEPGFLEGVQISASVMVPPGEALPADDRLGAALVERVARGEGATLLHRVRQSEEGGRFYQDENDYEVVLLEPGVDLELGRGDRWVTLAQLRRLLPTSGVFSMELRGVLALLLRYL